VTLVQHIQQPLAIKDSTFPCGRMFPSAERSRWNLDACFVYCWTEW